MIYKAKKLFNGCVSVRSYIVDRCIKRGEDLVITFNNRKMSVPLASLKAQDYTKMTPRTFRSKWGNETYELYDFTWYVDSEREKDQLLMFGNNPISTEPRETKTWWEELR